MASVTFDRVAKVYADGTRAVSGLDLEIADREFMVLVGRPGAVKTTALRMLAGGNRLGANPVPAGAVLDSLLSRPED